MVEVLLVIVKVLSAVVITFSETPFESVDTTVSPGDFHVIVLISVFENESTEDVDITAMRLYLKLRYFIGRQQLKNKDLKIGYVAYNVNNNSKQLTNSLTTILLDEEIKSKMLRSKQQNISYTCCQYSSNVVAVVSYMSKQLTKQAARIMSLGNIPYFAFSDEIMTKYYDNRFSNFRSSSNLINSDILYYRKLLSSHSINQIALINLYDKKSKMVNLHQSLLWNDLIKEDKSCVFKIAIHSKNINEMQDYVSHIRHNHDLQMIIIWSSTRDRKIFIQLTKGISDRHWFWYTDRTFVNTDPLNYFDIDKRSLDSHVFVSNPIFKYSILNKRFPYSEMKYNLNKKAYHDIITDPWVKN